MMLLSHQYNNYKVSLKKVLKSAGCFSYYFIYMYIVVTKINVCRNLLQAKCLSLSVTFKVYAIVHLVIVNGTQVTEIWYVITTYFDALNLNCHICIHSDGLILLKDGTSFWESLLCITNNYQQIDIVVV